MKILQVHNEYRYLGGEEAVIDAEYKMLNNYGHVVQQWIVKNSVIEDYPISEKVKLSFKSTWSRDSYLAVKKKLQEFQPDIVHVHNTIPLITSSVYSCLGTKIKYHQHIICK